MAVPMAVVGSVLLIAVLYNTLATLETDDLRRRIAGYLAKPPGDGLRMSVDQVITAMRVLVYLNGVLAAVVAVCAVYVFQRHRGARIGQSVAAIVLVFTGLLSGTIVPLVIGLSTAMLWTRPVRDWFGSRTPRPTAVVTPAYPALPPAASMPQRVPAPPMPHPVHRPGSLIAAAAITFVFSAVTLLGYLAIVGVMLVDRQALVEAFQRQSVYVRLDMTANELIGFLWIACVVMSMWCLASIAMAALMLRRHTWARVALAVSAGLALPLSLIALPFGWLNAAAEVATIVLLFSGGANDWFARRPPGSPYPRPRGNVW
jgi:hypothetical protein